MLVQHVVGGSSKQLNHFEDLPQELRDEGSTVSLFSNPYVSVDKAKPIHSLSAV